MKRLAYSLIAGAVTLALTACNGDDGAQGPQGVQGTAGQNGVDGQNGQDGANGQPGNDGVNGKDGVNGGSGLIRIATVPNGAEVTGLFLTEQGDLFFNVQHPADSNTVTADGKTFNKGTVGVLTGVDFNNLPRNIVSSPVPASEQEQQIVMSAIGQYQVLGQTGDVFADLGAKGVAGGLGVHYGINSKQEIIRNDNPDFNGFIATSNTEGYLYTNWESYPGGMSRLKMSKDTKGKWSVTEAMMVDFDSVQGTAANCFGSMSPWGTPLTSEEWIVNSSVTSTTAASWNDPADTRTDGIEALVAPDFPNPYRYGYIAEVQNPTSASPDVVKHFTIGRYEHENSVVMPDERTVYSSQDDTGGVLFKFVADHPKDLSSGTLYGAKLTQDEGLNDPAVTGFDIQWVELASGNNADIATWIAEYDNITTADYVDGQSSYITMADVQAWADGDQTYPTVEQGGGPITAGKPMDNRVAFLESRQAARLKGATAEWRKLEGISINLDRVKEAVTGEDLIEGEIVDKAYMYIGVADIDNTMIDDEGDIQLSSRVKDCGGVYRAAIDNNYNLTRIEPVVMGGTYRSSLTGAERCDVNQLSQPDNVIVMRDGRIIIGEDGFQDNNTLWLYDPKSK
ncbi:MULTISPECIES: alkaline phosphatase PhoX [Pseudoalteromonas]|uniref:Cell surface protein n=1 Tax=Pseudoalteromonas amylolytica TaxID=1859457 RepID=A0A1S1MTJ5_9GAMM|nr:MULTISPECIES: alkaline phosphatase PhoX [Pseudoalteromonas]OHU85084.1 cell surface protein [Pseudoalteromonas sp. JW3]OHU89964.1 cell surface protein [Pseudoalteromonas amylolytica]